MGAVLVNVLMVGVLVTGIHLVGGLVANICSAKCLIE